MKHTSAFFLLLAIACGDGGPSESGAIGAAGATGRNLKDDQCVSDVECSDGRFCNGAELCAPDQKEADEFGCVAGRTKPRCDDGIECTLDSCSDSLGQCVFEAPDADQDGHRDADCEDDDGEPLGDDCDDDDANRFPGNVEICDPDDHDEDCDVKTFGERDRDGDTEFDALCCNRTKSKKYCGTDCNDLSIAQRSKQPEFCDDIDNDCNGIVDDDPGPVAWYPDADHDLFGAIGSEPEYSCEPIAGASLLSTDCRDDKVGQHPAQTEICDFIDNDCNGLIDEPWFCDQGGGIVVGEDGWDETSNGGSLGTGGAEGGSGGTGGDEGSGGKGSGGKGSGGTASGGSGGTGGLGTGTPAVVWFDDFESGFGDWSVEGGEWAIGVPAFNSGPTPLSGTNLAGTNLVGNHAADLNARLVSPALLIPDASEVPRLKYRYWYSLGSGDTGRVQIKVGSEDWVDLPEAGVLSWWSQAWAPGMLQLSAWAGETVRFGFLLTSDAGTSLSGSQRAGWYLDDVSLETGPMEWNEMESFEGAFGDWSVQGGQWAIGSPASGVGPDAYEGVALAGTVLEGTHAADQNCRLVSPVILVPQSASNPRLRFAYWYSLGSGDTGEVQVRPLGGAWQTIDTFGILSGFSQAWAPGTAPLSAWAGQSVQLGFFFQSNAGTNISGSQRDGWYIDQVEFVTD